MTDYKPWFERVPAMTKQSNSDELVVNYKSEYLRMMEENITLRLMIGNLVFEKCQLSIELNELKSQSLPVETIDNEDEPVFSNDCSTAVKELLEILKNNIHFKYTSHRQREIENAYYSIINNIGITIFYLEDHSENNWHGLGGSALITTPLPGGIVEGYKHKYASVSSGWDNRTTSRSMRKRYDIRGKKVMDVMDILNTFR